MTIQGQDKEPENKVIQNPPFAGEGSPAIACCGQGNLQAGVCCAHLQRTLRFALDDAVAEAIIDH